MRAVKLQLNVFLRRGYSWRKCTPMLNRSQHRCIGSRVMIFPCSQPSRHSPGNCTKDANNPFIFDAWSLSFCLGGAQCLCWQNATRILYHAEVVSETACVHGWAMDLAKATIFCLRMTIRNSKLWCANGRSNLSKRLQASSRYWDTFSIAIHFQGPMGPSKICLQRWAACLHQVHRGSL